MASSFPHPYLPHTDAHRREMLEAVGVPSVEALFQDIPQAYRDPALPLPEPLSELELLREMEALAARNLAGNGAACFLGGGAYRHFIPSVVPAILSRGELLTCYTPYQPEVSQGTLQATYEFQSMLCELTGMEVANAGMYDGASALAEAALMACRVTRRYRVAVLEGVNPRYREVLELYLRPQGVEVAVAAAGAPGVDGETACLVAQYPDFFGAVTDLGFVVEQAHAHGALAVVSAYPLALGLLKPPGDYGVDVVTGECQSLGVPLSFGGPYVGLFACQSTYLRQMPGRVVGRTVDGEGRTGYVLTLQTREQHIRRERATSNICTSEALVATGVAVYLAAMGPAGLRRAAELCYHKAHYAASRVAALPGYAVHPQWRGAERPWFNEFVVACPVPPGDLGRRLLGTGIIGGLDISSMVPGGMLLAVTEMNTRAEIDRLVEALAGAAREGEA